MESGQYTEHGIAPLWHTDLLTCFTTQLTNKWRSTIRQDTHRYLLCGTRPSDLSGKDLITQEVLHRQELVHLARARCGESELWGRLYWAVRNCTNQCRFCNISPEPSAYMRSNNDPTAPGTDTVPPSAREEDVSPARRRTLTRRRKEKCPHCDSTLTGFSNLVSHCRSFHPEHSHRFPSSNAISVAWFSPHGEAPHSTGIAAHKTQTPHDIETAVPGGDLCCRRISQLPQARQSARRKPCTICF
ncbi:unspecified product [Trypanosoma cruzi Dm28c]|uniref:Unspecified product n=2 Tax=Trypanosoma cruzi TaxID=5693 RepID=V5A267_TRYCR|nr:unspecified product [Trypanosoma cruzi Dm28c]